MRLVGFLDLMSPLSLSRRQANGIPPSWVDETVHVGFGELDGRRIALASRAQQRKEAILLPEPPRAAYVQAGDRLLLYLVSADPAKGVSAPITLNDNVIGRVATLPPRKAVGIVLNHLVGMHRGKEPRGAAAAILARDPKSGRSIAFVDSWRGASHNLSSTFARSNDKQHPLDEGEWIVLCDARSMPADPRRLQEELTAITSSTGALASLRAVTAAPLTLIAACDAMVPSSDSTSRYRQKTSSDGTRADASGSERSAPQAVSAPSTRAPELPVLPAHQSETQNPVVATTVRAGQSAARPDSPGLSVNVVRPLIIAVNVSSGMMPLLGEIEESINTFLTLSHEDPEVRYTYAVGVMTYATGSEVIRDLAPLLEPPRRITLSPGGGHSEGTMLATAAAQFARYQPQSSYRLAPPALIVMTVAFDNGARYAADDIANFRKQMPAASIGVLAIHNAAPRLAPDTDVALLKLASHRSLISSALSVKAIASILSRMEELRRDTPETED